MLQEFIIITLACFKGSLSKAQLDKALPDSAIALEKSAEKTRI